MKRRVVLLWLIVIAICALLYLAADNDSAEKTQSKAHVLIQQNIEQKQNDLKEPIYNHKAQTKAPTIPPLDVAPLFWFVPANVMNCRDLFRYVCV